MPSKRKCKPRCAGAAEGEEIKAEKLAMLEARREVYVRRGRRAMLETLLRNGTATADDVRAEVELPSDIDARCLGTGLLQTRPGVAWQLNG